VVGFRQKTSVPPKGAVLHHPSLVPANDGAICDDGRWCSEISFCSGGECLEAKERCPAVDQCNIYECIEESQSCIPLDTDGQFCADGDACTIFDECQGGLCKGEPASPCNDFNPCTDDSCDPGTGCVFQPNTLDCDDKNACTVGDQCAEGVCQPGEPLACDDGIECTKDVCVPESGCAFIAQNAQCDDLDACTGGDLCSPDGCTSLSNADCSLPATSFVTQCDPQLGCVAFNPLCGNSQLDAGEECDDGAFVDGDGCNHRCHVEKRLFTPPFNVSDIDVDAHGQVVAVGLYTPDGVNVQCFDTLSAWQSTKILWVSGPQVANLSSDGPWVVRAGTSGHSMMVWRHLIIPNDFSNARLDVVYLDPECSTVSAPVRLADVHTQEFYDIDIDDEGNGVVAFGINGRGYLRFFKPNGSPLSEENLELPGPNCNFGIHVALSSLGNGGVVSCQGDLPEGVVFWRFDSSGRLTSTAQAVPDAAGKTAWYDSHSLWVAPGGEFVILNADPATAETRRALYDRSGTLVLSDTVAQNSSLPPFCYDTYRYGRIKNNFLDGLAWTSVVSSGGCFATDHTTLLGMALSNPSAPVVAIDAALPLQRLTIDRMGRTYMLNDNGEIMINYVALP